MDDPPAQIIEDLGVVLFTPIDERHEQNPGHINRAAGLLICRDEAEACCYLLSCDATWTQQFDTWHETLEEAKEQAEYEYKGASKTWMRPE